MNIFTHKKYLFGTIVFAATLICSAGISHAASKTWTPTSGNLWGTAANWTPNGTPGATDDLIFSASSTSNSTIDAGYTANSITITAGYTGIISQNSGSFTDTFTAGFSQAGGTFTGGPSANNKITMSGGTVSLTGGTFVAPSGTLAIWSPSITFGGTFVATAGTTFLGVQTAATTITGSATFNNLYMGQLSTNSASRATITIAAGTTLTANGFFGLSVYNANFDKITFLGSGAVNLNGNIETATTPGDPLQATGTVAFALTGSGTQIVGESAQNGAAGVSVPGNPSVILPNLTINKPSGNVTLTSYIEIMGNFMNLSSSTMNPTTTSTVLIGPQGFDTNYVAFNPVASGSATFNNLLLNSQVGDTFTVPTGTVLTVQGDFGTLANFTTWKYLGGGTVNVTGNFEDAPTQNFSSSTVAFQMTGSGNQIIGDSTLTSPFTNQGCHVMLPNLTINKSGGNITMKDSLCVVQNFTNVNATTILPGTTTVYIGVYESWDSKTALNPIITGSSTFYNLELGNELENDSVTIATGTVLNVLGYYKTVNGFTRMSLLGGGALNISGNVEITASPLSVSSTVPITLVGTSTQILGDDNPYEDNFTSSGQTELLLSNLTINKPSGIVIGSSTVVIQGALNLISGELRVSSGTASQSMEVDATTTIGVGTLFDNFPQASSTLSLAGNLVNNGTMWFDGSGNGCTVTLPNYAIIKSNANGTPRAWSGTGGFLLRYVSIRDQNATAIGGGVVALNSTSVSGNSGITFTNGPEPELVQSATNSAAATSVSIPLSMYYPKSGDLVLVAVSAQNETISAPTDNIGNTYTLISSSTFGADTLALYYAKGINNSSTFSVTANAANATAGNLITASAFEFTGIDPSSTFDAYVANTDNTGSATTETTNGITGSSYSELYFGTMTLAASTTATGEAGWTTGVGNTNNTAAEALYTQFVASSSILSTASTWTTPSTTAYAAVMAVFRSPYTVGYAKSGTLDSATFDTGVTSGAVLNSVVWQGSNPNGSSVGFQLAVSNASSGPWTYMGPGGSGSQYFIGNAGTIIPFSQSGSGYSLFSGYRYYRYRVTLFSDPSQAYTPTVSGVTVNWSP